MKFLNILRGQIWARGPHKAFSCYIFMLLWILLLIAGIYKFIDPVQNAIDGSSTLTYEPLFQQSLNYDVKTKKIFTICNEPHNMLPGNEGLYESKQGWTLKGILVFLRHGDRGPLQHIRNVSTIRCSTPETDLLANYKAYLHNLTVTGKVNWIGPGSFHGFPLLPSHQSLCQIGQLTFQGISQLLTLGSLMQTDYAAVWQQLRSLSPSQVVVYSTRYRRTFQSALAFLYGLLGPTDTFNKLPFVESQSMTFCFKDCACPVAEKYLKLVLKALNLELKSHPAISYLAKTTSKAIFTLDLEHGDFSRDPHAVRDALLTYVCHNSYLPCESPFSNCIRRHNVVGIFAYTDWVSHGRSKNANYKRLCALRSYGLIKHIVSHMLHMLSGNGPRLVVYSGHDHTLEQLATALGLPNEPTLARYAGRLVFEVYSDEHDDLPNASGAYFRLLANGRDVTRRVSFCKAFVTPYDHNTKLNNNNNFDRNSNFNYNNNDNNNNNDGDATVNLCKVEDIVRFIHDDYFAPFNVTNFKDACFPKTN